MPETRSPEQMPTAWRVKEFSHEKGFGLLVHESGEEVTFGIETWDLGSWRPSRKDAAAAGPASPTLPRAGEPVQVRWKRSRAGANIPARVQPTGRVAVERRLYKLGSWLTGIQRAGGFADLTDAALLEAVARLDPERAEDWRDGEPREAGDFAFLLMDIANLRGVDPAWTAEHAGWIYADDHRWDRERARGTLPAMLALDAAPEPAGSGESLVDYAARCNAAAEQSGRALRLHEVGLDGDAHVLVALPPAVFASLVKDGFLPVI